MLAFSKQIHVPQAKINSGMFDVNVKSYRPQKKHLNRNLSVLLLNASQEKTFSLYFNQA